MFAGKTTSMLAQAEKFEEQGKRVVYVKSPVDNHFSGIKIVSHNGTCKKVD